MKKYEEEKEHITGISLEHWVFGEIMDKMNANIYVTDIETDRILFMNRRMKEAFGLDEPIGKICWQTLKKGRTHRCDDCPIFQLEKNKKEADSYMWEADDLSNNRIYECFDSLIKWYDGRTAHFQYSVDVTEVKRLYRQASTDELTGVLNRRAGKTALKKSMEKAQRSDEPLVLAMIDANELKQVNDKLGHQAGDQLLVTIASRISGVLNEKEYLFRLGGDEFVVVFSHTTEKEAERKLKNVLQGIRKENLPGVMTQNAFCFGAVCVEMDEIDSVDDLLCAADEKLYQYKRTAHIERANERLKQLNHPTDAEPFSYNKELLYDALAQSTDDYIYVCNMKTGVFQYPQSMVDEFGLPGRIIENAAAVWGAKVHEHDKAAFLESNQEIADGRTDCHRVEYRALNHEGQWVWLRCRGRLERDKNGEPELFAGIITNLGNKNRIDHLTGLLNKFEFIHQLELLTQEDRDAPFSLLHLGLDNLKRVNDLYDRHFGDEVIRIAAQRLQSLLPNNGMLFRLDGDEFAVILFGKDKAMAQNFFRSLQKSFGKQQSYDNRTFFCTISCGCVTFPEYAAAHMELIKYAGYALNYAKQSGKDRIVFFFREMLVEKVRVLGIEELLRESINNGFRGFEAYFQPVFDKHKKLVGAECLSRWASEKFGRVGPDEFIPLLEKNDLILKLGRWIFEEAVKKSVEWTRIGYPIKISVNVSASQMEDEGLLHFIRSTLSKYHADPRLLMLELTESYFADSGENLSMILSQCREMGMSVAIDDFGTGYSSLGLLKLAPADVVKIDRTFIKGIRDRKFDRSFVSLIADLCHVMDMDVCVEGVEDEEDYQAVAEMDIQYIQGFYLGRPVPKRSFEEMFLIKY
ncbi:diguanylate cyclase domain-containing protein [Hominibacterium faecale]|uniref:bifunctional diguanylate cyclase/phosphodiesterase n=1 Tax=Hominibacterium faecale TaxID=2839743 RepID=UPI0022B29AA6|nr:diguanylate cyclase [Hominibacterium faecale]